MAKTTAKKRALHRANKTTQAEVFKRIDALLARHGISGTLNELHLELGPASLAPAANGDASGLPRRSVCKKLPNGQIKCIEV